MEKIGNENREGLRDALLVELIEKRAASVRALDGLRGALIGHGFVVVSSAGIALKYEIDAKTNNVKSVTQAGGAGNATRFNKSDAENVAASTVDGRGLVANAVHVTQALRDEIDRLESVIQMVKSA